MTAAAAARHQILAELLKWLLENVVIKVNYIQAPHAVAWAIFQSFQGVAVTVAATGGGTVPARTWKVAQQTPFGPPHSILIATSADPPSGCDPGIVFNAVDGDDCSSAACTLAALAAAAFSLSLSAGSSITCLRQNGLRSAPYTPRRHTFRDRFVEKDPPRRARSTILSPYSIVA